MQMQENDVLSRIFAEVGKTNGYDNVTAVFAAFSDFKVKWSRSYAWASFEVSDYMMEAPENVMTSLAESIYAKIKNGGVGDYPDDVCDWLTSQSFIDRNQTLYVKRCRGISRGSEGVNRDLMESVRRLEDMELVRHDPRLIIRWSSGSWKVCAKASTLMKVVRITDKLDSFDVPDCVVDYAVYSALVHLSQGFTQSSESRRLEYARLLENYPYREDAEYGMRRVNLTI